MAKTVIEIGQKITLQLIKRGNIFSPKNVDETSYNSTILHVKNERDLTITVPLYSNTLLSMSVNDIYTIRFFSRNGIYTCKCVVTGKGHEGHIATVDVKLISGLERNQRREYYRLELKAKLNWAKLDENQEKLYVDLKNAVTDARRRIIKEQIKMEDIPFCKGMMMDISGGGMRFNSTEILEQDDVVILIPDIPELAPHIPYLMGKVVLTRPLETKTATYENKIKFINISSDEREKIITYIFAVEREKMRTD